MKQTPPNPSQSESLRAHLGAFSIVLAAGFMTLLDVSIVNVALPSMEASLGAGPDQIQWIVAGYALTFGLSLVGAGRAGDVFGRRMLFIVGLVGFVFASAGCGFADSALTLIIMRLLQGAFAGVLNPQILAIMQDLYSGPTRARAFGIFGIVVGVSTAIGPALGGALINLAGPELGWRLVFLINLPIGAVVLGFAFKLLPKTLRRGKVSLKAWIEDFDPIGVFVLGMIVLGVMWPFLTASSEAGSPTSIVDYWPLALSVVGMGIMYLWEKFWHGRGHAVLLDPTLVHDGSFVLGSLTAFFYFAGFTSLFLTITLYLQQGLMWTPLEAGLAMVPFALISGASSGISGRLVNRFGRWVPVAGVAIVIIGMLGMAAAAYYLQGPSGPLWVLIAMGVAGVGSGIVISPNQALTLDSVPREEAGVAAAVLQTFQRLGAAIGLSVVTTVFFVAIGRLAPSEGAGRAHSVALALSSLAIAGILLLAMASNLIDATRRNRTDMSQVRKVIEQQGRVDETGG